MPEPEDSVERHSKWYRNRGAMAGLAVVGIGAVLLLYQMCNVEPPREFGTVGGGGEIVEEEELEEEGEEPPEEEAEPELNPRGGTYRVDFSKGKGSCSGFPSEFTIGINVTFRGDRVRFEQEGTDQRTDGMYDPDTGTFRTRGTTGDHTEIYDGEWIDKDEFEAGYFYMNDCRYRSRADGTWERAPEDGENGEGDEPDEV